MEKCAAQVDATVFTVGQDVLNELLESELAVIGGGIGDVILG